MNLAEFMESLIDTIDGIGADLSMRNEYIDEMKAECRTALIDYK